MLQRTGREYAVAVKVRIRAEPVSSTTTRNQLPTRWPLLIALHKTRVRMSVQFESEHKQHILNWILLEFNNLFYFYVKDVR